MAVSIACEIMEEQDVAISVNGRIPCFPDYRAAYAWLSKLGYNQGGKIATVYDCTDRDMAVRRFGNRLMEARKLLK